MATNGNDGVRRGALLTDKVIRGAKPQAADYWLTDPSPRGSGSLVLRVGRSGAKGFYFRFVGRNGRRELATLGPYRSSDDADGITLAEARAKADEIRDQLRRGIDPKASATPAAASGAIKKSGEKDVSLRKLLDLYVKKLEAAGKRRPKDVENTFRRRILDPDLGYAWVDSPARSVTVSQLKSSITKVLGLGHRSEAKHLRSMLHSAYAFAVSAANDPEAPSELEAFGVEINPISGIKVPADHCSTSTRSLSDEELAHYQRAIDTIKSAPIRLTLRAHLLLGAQRPAQLTRATVRDVDVAGGVLTLWDGKGRRPAPVPHELPLSESLTAIYCELLGMLDGGELVHSTSSGVDSIAPETLSHTVTDISKKLVEAKAIRLAFRLGDIRRTVETQLTKLGVEKETRARLLSHELGGLINRHYNRHEFWREKTDALLLWQSHLAQVLERYPADA